MRGRTSIRLVVELLNWIPARRPKWSRPPDLDARPTGADPALSLREARRDPSTRRLAGCRGVLDDQRDESMHSRRPARALRVATRFHARDAHGARTHGACPVRLRAPPCALHAGSVQPLFPRYLSQMYVFICLAPSFLPSPAVRVTRIIESKCRRKHSTPANSGVLGNTQPLQILAFWERLGVKC